MTSPYDIGLPTEAPETHKLERESSTQDDFTACHNNACCVGVFDEDSSRTGQAMDIVVVTSVLKRQLRTEANIEGLWNSAKISSSDFYVTFPFLNNSNSTSVEVQIEINGTVIPELIMTLDPSSSNGELIFVHTSTKKPLDSVLRIIAHNRTLHLGMNIVRYIARSTGDIEPNGSSSSLGKLKRIGNLAKNTSNKRLIKDSKGVSNVKYPSFLGTADANLFLWSSNDFVCVSDIDGTVTKSDIIGAVDTIFTERYKHVHSGICSLFSKMASPQYLPTADVHFMYLTARPIKFASSTRKFISSLYQDQTSLRSNVDQSTCMVRLPPGPIFCYPGTLSNVVSMELIKKNTHEFKAKTIVTQIREPFQKAGKDLSRNPFIAAFGNKNTDRKAYLNSGVDEENIYIINCASGNIVKTATERNIFDKSEGKNQTRGVKKNGKQRRRSSLSEFSKAIASSCSKSPASRRTSMTSSFSLLDDDSDENSATPLDRDAKLEYTGYNDPRLMKEIFEQCNFTFRTNKQASIIEKTCA